MKALKLSSNVEEKKQLKARCGALIDTADRIKNSEEWTPSVDPYPEDVRISRWAASIDPRHSSGSAYQESGSVWADSSPHQSTLEQTPRSASGKSPISSASFSSRTQPLYAERTEQHLYGNDSQHSSMPLIDLSDDHPETVYENSWQTPADLQRKGSQAHEKDLLGSGSTSDIAQSNSSPSQSGHQPPITAASNSAVIALGRAQTERVASPAHIRRLTEPVSNRKRSRKEDIILLKASVVNGFKCPPWDKTPAAAEFLRENGQELFQYVYTHVQRPCLTNMQVMFVI